MIRRTLHALAALAAAAVLVVVPGGPPAEAAPPTAPTLCTITEFEQPGNFVDCTKRLGAVAQDRLQCVHAPTPDSPGDGISGWLTSRPDNDLRSGVNGMYSTYGVAGYQYSLYDVSCLGPLVHAPGTAADAGANFEFAVASSTVGAANGLRELAYNPRDMWSKADPYVASATDATYRWVFSIFGILSLVMVGLWLLWQAPRGQMSAAMAVASWAAMVMVLITAIGHYPQVSVHVADTAAVTGLDAMHSVPYLSPAPENVPASKCVLSPDACVDHRSMSVRASDTATKDILYHSWVGGLLGSSTSPTAVKYGPALYDAQTLSWADAETITQHPEAQQVILQAKADQWQRIAEQIRTEDPRAYENLQGLHGGNRLAFGFIALITSWLYAAFDMAASVIVLLGFVIFRMAVITAPILGTVGILRPASSGLRKLLNTVAASVINIVVFGGGAGLYLEVVGWILDSDLPGLVQLVGVGLAGIVLALLLNPLRRTVQIAAHVRSRDKKTLWQMARTFTSRRGDNAETRSASPAADGSPTATRRPRPETTATTAASSSSTTSGGSRPGRTGRAGPAAYPSSSSVTPLVPDTHTVQRRHRPETTAGTSRPTRPPATPAAVSPSTSPRTATVTTRPRPELTSGRPS